MVSQENFDCSGEMSAFRRDTNGVGFEEMVCATCFTRIYNANDALPDFAFIRAGTLHSSQDIEPFAHIWTKRKQAWIVLSDEIPSFEVSPTAEEFAVALEAAKSSIPDGS
tara:strand:- start:479 stop:808 length:330 start_codon:yes stop_codon:yes gene_type:complete